MSISTSNIVTKSLDEFNNTFQGCQSWIRIIKHIIKKYYRTFLSVDYSYHLSMWTFRRKRLLHNLHLQNQTKKVLDDQQQTNEFE